MKTGMKRRHTTAKMVETKKPTKIHLTILNSFSSMVLI
ncbi:hypothetical protein HMPREF1146_1646 [Prevotella sp. MSX73]|nr:hypothetical protein HMPREF1146_1646 [Prevotella sp. MSX73]